MTKKKLSALLFTLTPFLCGGCGHGPSKNIKSSGDTEDTATVDTDVDGDTDTDVDTDADTDADTDTDTDTGWTLVWQDEFDGSALDTDKWIAVDNCGDKRNSEQQCYRKSAVSVAGGMLTLTATDSPSGNFEYTSGAVKTGDKFTVSYGKIEFRAQMPEGGQGVWPALWLYPPDQWPPEIDVLEAINTMSTIYMTYHWGTSGTHQQDGGSTTISDPQGWHLYAVEWEENEVRWTIDGELKQTHTGADVTDIPMQLYINVALGGAWPGNVGSETVFPQKMNVDYVRVYKKE